MKTERGIVLERKNSYHRDSVQYLDTIKFIDDAGNIIYFSKDFIIKDILWVKNYVQNLADSEELKCYNKKQAIICTKLDEMIALVNAWTEEDIEKIIECLPRLKNGSLRSTTLPIYLSGVTYHEVAYSRTTSLEVSAKPLSAYCPVNIKDNNLYFDFKPWDKAKNVFYISFTDDRVYDKSDKPVIQADGSYAKVEYSRKTYLKMSELVPGYVYVDAKEKEYLYLGATSVFPYTFFSLNDKRKRDMQASDSFGNYMSAFIKNIISKPDGYGHFVTSYEGQGLKENKNFQVVEQREQIFDKEHLLCSITVEVDKGDQHPDLVATGQDWAYHEKVWFAVEDKTPMWQYKVYANTMHDRIELGTVYNKKEAEKLIKDYTSMKEHRKSKPYYFEELVAVNKPW